MDYLIVFKAAGIVGGLSFLMGGILALASTKLKVEVNPLVEKILEVLPGSNCGACGMPGCEGAAEAIADGKASYDACRAGGPEIAEAVAEVLGVEAKVEENRVAPVLNCGLNRSEATKKGTYNGVRDCLVAEQQTKGDLICLYGCLGFGSCEKACPFDAIKMDENQLPVFDLKKCTRCGICVSTCPRGLIKFVPEEARLVIKCSSKERGKEVLNACKKGCIACGICVKACPEGLSLVENIVVIDYEKNPDCPTGVEKCPTKCLIPYKA